MPKALGIIPWLDEFSQVFVHLFQWTDFPALSCFRGKAEWSMNQTNDSYLQDFKSHLRAKNLQPESARTYCADIRQYLDWLTERELVSPLLATAQDAQDYVAFLSIPIHALRGHKTGSYSVTTITRKVKTLRYFYDFLYESEEK